jgi:hypothetical protein
MIVVQHRADAVVLTCQTDAFRDEMYTHFAAPYNKASSNCCAKVRLMHVMMRLSSC